ncbi:hypothetical protein FA13DRAFT_1820837 [Coprinellus micaceus]|uniref:NACHT domain-containing protein n=1 Tax=Coprinellus micaceus TaxID=71717 RepID=A0A4Y7SEZ2_COPMI|nr:hypothetical protein FA13DRAFT_1820837 [Coprinellus micaceus]
MSPKSALKGLISRYKKPSHPTLQDHPAPVVHTTAPNEREGSIPLQSPSSLVSQTPPPRIDVLTAPPKLRVETEFLDASKPSPGSTPSDMSGTPGRSPSQPSGSRTTFQSSLDVKPSQTGPSLFFPNASHFSIEKVHVEGFTRESPGWEVLRKHIAADALYDSAARFDAPKCDEDTRIEVLSEIMGWAKSEDAPQALLVITGPAGAGKSAIMQTLCTTADAEEHQILGASFFFSVTDPSRNLTAPFVATLAFQLALASPILRPAISLAITTLIVEPYLHNKHLLPPGTPYLILIDGLDECNNEERQDELLRAINRCLASGKTPFRFIFASRPEWAIFSALQRNGHLDGVAYHIELNNGYDARLDIERYLRRRFNDLGRTLGLEIGWPGEPIVQRLALNASGQFVYVATVMKYVSDRRASPIERLQAVISWTPGAGSRSRPFAGLDALYSAILTTARDNFQSIDSNEHDLVLLLHTLVRLWQDTSFAHRRWLKPDWGKFFCLAGGSIHSLVADLRSLAYVTQGVKSTETLAFYHKSFLDFLMDPARSTSLFKTVEEVDALVVDLAFYHIRTHISLLKADASPQDSHVFDVSVETLSIFLEEEIESSAGHSIASVIDIARQFTKLKLWPEVFKRRRVPDRVSARRDYIEKILSFLEREDEPRLAHQISKQTQFLALTSRTIRGDGFRTPSSPSSPWSPTSRTS